MNHSFIIQNIIQYALKNLLIYLVGFLKQKSDLLLSHFDILCTYSKPIFIKKLQEVLQHNTVEKNI